MRILVVAPQPFYQERGTPMAVRLLVETLCSLGHHVDLLVYHEGVAVAIPGMRLFRAPRPPGIRAVPIGISWQKLVCDVGLIGSMIGLMLRNRYDAIHAVEEAVFPAAWLSLFTRHRLVYDMDSSLSEQLVDKWRFMRPVAALLALFERGAVRRSTAVLAVCEDLAVKVRRWKDAQSVFVLPDVPMGDANAPGSVESLRDLVGPAATLGLYVGNLESYQGIDLLLDAMARLDAHCGLQLVVIGGQSTHVQKYRDRASQLDLSARVHLLGARPVSQLNAYLAQADILVSPRTLGQNTPMKIYSYMQSGRAILATDIRSHTQVLDASCAELVQPQPDAMAAGLQRLAGDASLRTRLGAAARDKVEREFSLPVFRARLEQAYALVAAG